MKPENVKIEINMAIEFISAAYAYAKRNEEGETSRAENIAQDSKAVLWFEQLETSISPYEENELQLIFSTVSAKFFLDFTIGVKKIKGPEELLVNLKKMSEEEFFSGFMAILHLKGASPEDLEEKQLRKALEADRGIQVQSIDEEARRLVRLLSNPDRFRRAITEALESFYTAAFRKEIPGILKILEQKKREHEILLRKNPKAFLDRLTLGTYGSLLNKRLEKNEEILLIPVFLHQHCLDLMTAGAVVIYGLAHDALVQGKDIEGKLDTYIKALNDPNRLKMLRLLTGRKLFGRELADRLELSTATVSYHMDKLLAAGLIQLDSSEQRKFYYTINPGGIREFIASLEREFL